ncbi:hypothetical protein N0V82_000308 [Gnomoniopsis sp. IMI 355080]|nr:hypothetical protein N0V82_000308 [Gnomoniopsis sp. IMI 355080]
MSSVAAAAPAAGAKLISPEPAASAREKSVEKPKLSWAIASVTDDEKTVDPGRVSCDLYYKGTPWQPELKESFSDATSALSQFALRHILTENRDCSSTLLWTGDIQTQNLHVKQTFTVYALIDGPKRTKIQKKYKLPWAIITFTDGSSSTKTNQNLHEEDERLRTTVQIITSMGYHVNVWTYLDDDGWDMDLDLAEAELARQSAGDKHIRNLSRSPSLFFDPQHLKRRSRYEVFVQHGVAGFIQADLDLFDKLYLHFERLGWGKPQSGAGLELMGFLEHAEETIVEVD